MKYDGTVWINTEIDDDGLEKGFDRLRDGADDVAVTVQKLGSVIENAFATAGDSKAVTKACSKLEELKTSYAAVGEQLEAEKQKLATLKEDYAWLTEQLDIYSNQAGTGFNMDLDTFLEYQEAVKTLPGEIEKQTAVVEQLESKWTKVSDAVESAVEKVTATVNAETEKQTAAAEKAAAERASAAEQAASREQAAYRETTDVVIEESAEQQGVISSAFESAGDSVSTFNTRIKKLAWNAFVFNIIRSGLSSVVSYFSSALSANEEFSASIESLETSLKTAFQPIIETVLPYLIKLINWLDLAVQAVARFFATLTGNDYEEMRDAVISMGDDSTSVEDTSDAYDDVSDSIENVGEAAEEASKYLAGFDEINQMLEEDVSSLSDSLDDTSDSIDEITSSSGSSADVDFDDVELPSEWEAVIDSLAMQIDDVLFDWDDLTGEDIAEKLVTALTTIAGAYIGFSLGGVGGAVFGAVIGLGLGLLLTDMIFNDDGKISAEELCKTLVTILAGLVGLFITVTVGGTAGAAIGAVVGVGLSLLLVSCLFDDDDKLSESEIADTLIVVLGAVMGFIVWSVAGTLSGGLLGAVAGVALGLCIKSISFNKDGVFSESELGSALALTLGTIGAALGFFAVGGVAGVAIGLSAGLLVKCLIEDLVFNGDGQLDTNEIVSALVIALSAAVGGVIGFYVAGGMGAAFGALVGATIGLAIAFTLQNVEFGEVKEGYEEVGQTVEKESKKMTETTENEYIKPTSSAHRELTSEMKTEYSEAKDNIVSDMESATSGSETAFFEPMEKMSSQLKESITMDSKNAAEKTTDYWRTAADDIQTDYIDPVKDQFADVSQEIEDGFEGAKKNIQDMWKGMASWFQTTVTSPMLNFFNTLTDGIIDRFQSVTEQVNDAIEQMADQFDRIIDTYNSGIQSMTEAYNEAKSKVESSSSSVSYSTTSTASYSSVTYPTAEIPMLAKGAVIPPNHKFLAVLGDQRSGTNVEAPLSTIQEAVAMVMEDMIQSNVVGNESIISLLQQILEAVLGIELDGETLSNVLNNNNKKWSMVKGGSV